MENKIREYDAQTAAEAAKSYLESTTVQRYHELIINNKDGYDTGDPMSIAAMIQRYAKQGLLSGDEIRALFISFGLDPSDYGN